MKLHIFNPEHDIALAANLSNFTAPKAGRQLRHDLGFLPAIWAEGEDCVLVDDVEYARKHWGCLVAKHGNDQFSKHREDLFVSNPRQLPITEICPWGWNKALCAQLKRIGVKEDLLPDEEQLQRIRELSHRKTAVSLLRKLQLPGTTGYSSCADLIVEVEQALRVYRHIVVKAPWSSSGRGVRFISDTLDEHQEQWIRNVVKTQRCIIIEPYYNKVMDFAMEFTATTEGTVRYEGLSLFETNNGAYTGNLLATERKKQEMISRYIPADLLKNVTEKIVECLELKDYQGPFGIDMMIVSSDLNNQSSYLLHPCVEINLRRTMGHVALALHHKLNPDGDDSFLQVMQVGYDGSSYRLNCQNATAAAAATLSESTP